MDHLRETSTSINKILIALVKENSADAGSLSSVQDFPTRSSEFHSFPTRCGWKIEDNFKLNIERAVPRPLTFEVFLQRWLYFGLILTVVQEDGKPILEPNQLHTESILTTAGLNDAVQKWVDWEVKTPKDRAVRLIRTAQVLEKARSVVRYNCACCVSTAEPSTEAKDSSTSPVKITHRYKSDNDPSDLGPDSRTMTNENALALMLVGECLWAAQVRIIQQCKENLSGWHGDDDAGWGPPAYVITNMKDDGWCPRIMHLLKGQLRSSATMLLHAYSVYQKPSGQRASVMADGHKLCSQEKCHVDSSSHEMSILSQCRKDGGLCGHLCKPFGPDEEAIQAILRDSHPAYEKGRIPLLRFKSRPDAAEPELEVLWANPNERVQFAAISHVWADGWGNDEDNKLLGCQLRFIQRQLRQLSHIAVKSDEILDIPFWMDTLIIPAVKKAQRSDALRALRTAGIKQIVDVFAQSSFTIVLDKGLGLMQSQDNPLDNAMGLLASGWMRRLWTLHEAYLSRRHFIAYKEWGGGGGSKSNTLISLDNILNKLDTRASPLDFWIHTLLRQNLMHGESKSFAESGALFSPKQVAILVWGAWRAARWRTTSNTSHEALALATLLKVNHEGTEIESEGWRVDGTQFDAQKLMRVFWREFHSTYVHCIPPGIIFLPGEKLDFPGYGWAPTTWMSDEEVDFPDPMGSWTAATDLLEDKGLVVQYPGFRLFVDDSRARDAILFTNHIGKDVGFTFAADKSFLEWYTVKPADEHYFTPLEGVAHRNHPLAIILSRPHPKASPAEIGLLVEIHKVEDQRTWDHGHVHRNQRFRSHLIRRVRVHREMKAKFHSETSNNGSSYRWLGDPLRDGPVPEGQSSSIDDIPRIGQHLPPTQTWIVDKYFTPPSKSYAQPQAPTKTYSTSEPHRPEGVHEEGIIHNGLSSMPNFENNEKGPPSEAHHQRPDSMVGRDTKESTWQRVLNRVKRM